MKYLFLICSLFCSIGYSEKYGDFTCHQYQYGYINGILNTEEIQAENSAKLIEKKLKINKHINVFFNKSESLTVDLIRSVFQKIEESNKDGFLSTTKINLIIKYSQIFLGNALNIEDKSDNEILKWVLTDNQKTINNLISQNYDKDKNLIIFSHSQGNLYANKACDNLGIKTFENIQIATPASKINCGKPENYTSIHSDEMIKLLNTAGIPVSSMLGIKINFPLKTNASQQIDINSKNKFKTHSIENYLTNPPSLNKITLQHNSLLKNNFSDKSIISSKDLNINCDNIKDYVGIKIEITRSPASVLDKPIKISSKNSEKFYIEQKGDKYSISSFDLDSWFAHKFWFLYPFGFFLALMLLGPIAKAVKDSDKRREKDKR